MAELSAGRVVAIAAIASALVGAAVAAGVVMVSTSGNNNVATSTGSSSSVTTAAVVRTNLTNTLQIGGSIGYQGTYTVTAPSGASTQEMLQDKQAVTEDQQTLSDDEQSESSASTADSEALASDQAIVNTDQATISSDQVIETQDCAGTGASSSTCSQDSQKVSSDQTQLTQADQQLATAQSTATADHEHNQDMVQSDQTKLAGDQATSALAQASAVNPGTTYTALPQAGEIIGEGQSVYSVSNVAVPLLYGAVAAYRAFYVGMSKGADVGELTQDLIALGFGGGLTQSNDYSSTTATAVERWQRALGLPVTGEILLGQAVFEPGPIRVTSVTPSVGESVGGGGASSGGGGGTVLTATSTTPIVTVDLDVSQEYLVKPGDAVSIVLPNGTSTVGGRIETVGTVASCPGGGGVGTGASNSGSGSADQSPCTSSGSGTSSTPAVTVTITLDSTPAGATLDQAPVNVNITSQTANDVLAVPVNALLALQGGGFGVDVVTSTTSHLVGVTTGLYSNNLVQVSGSGISVGTRVQVPSS
jgi:Putative peptidoglycan binding domain